MCIPMARKWSQSPWFLRVSSIPPSTMSTSHDEPSRTVGGWMAVTCRNIYQLLTILLKPAFQKGWGKSTGSRCLEHRFHEDFPTKPRDCPIPPAQVAMASPHCATTGLSGPLGLLSAALDSCGSSKARGGISPMGAAWSDESDG